MLCWIFGALYVCFIYLRLLVGMHSTKIKYIGADE
jgi:hypothetical protein